MDRRRFCLLTISALALGACIPAGPGTKPAAKYPARALTFTTHSGPGGGGDLLGRQLIEALKPQSITAVLENKTGGSGAINMGYVAGRPMATP